MSDVSNYFIGLIKDKLIDETPISVCEFGCGDGETTKKIIALLRHYDQYYYFDYNKKVEKLKKEFSTANVLSLGFGNTDKQYDSYSWNLLKIFTTLYDLKQSPRIFDVVYLDASNIYLHDLTTCSIIKQMLKPGAKIVINNTEWSFKKSKYWNPETNQKTKTWLTNEQIEACQEELVCKILFETDPDYVLCDSPKNCKCYEFIP